MTNAIETKALTKVFGQNVALDALDLAIPAGRVVGLIGRNGSGKTTLLNHVLGLQLPTRGTCETLGRPSDRLDPALLQQIGVVHQDNRFLDALSVEDHLHYVSTFYPTWDHARRKKFLEELELDPKAKVKTLSPGNKQKLAVLLAVCHGPRLLLLDEPVSAMDPIAREALLRFLLDMLQEDPCTIVISSHVLRDVERVVDWIVCLDEGRLVENVALDELQERYAQWKVTSPEGNLPERIDEDYVLESDGDRHQARLLVRDGAAHQDAFRSRYAAEVQASPVNLERIFPALVGGGKR